MINLFTDRFRSLILSVKLVCLGSAMLFIADKSLAQTDTLLYENFNAPFDYASDDSDGVASEPSGSNLTWVNYDEDGLPTFGGAAGNWFWTQSSYHDSDSAQGGMMVSRSFLDGFMPGNRNWLITPPIYIADEEAVLHWKSAPAQGPRFMDGYSVLVSTGSNNPNDAPNPFQHEVFRAAFMTAITGDGASTDLSNYSFSPGYIHADGFTLTDYFIHADSLSEFDQHFGLLEPHAVSLSQFAGQTIYIAFLHNADDCFDLILDDILVTGNLSVNTSEPWSPVSLKIFPNPASSYVNIRYQVEGTHRIEATVYNAHGTAVLHSHVGVVSSGLQNHQINIEEFPAGHYSIQLYIDGQASRSVSFVKN